MTTPKSNPIRRLVQTPAPTAGPLEGQVLAKDGNMPPNLKPANSWDAAMKQVGPQAGLLG